MNILFQNTCKKIFRKWNNIVKTRRNDDTLGPFREENILITGILEKSSSSCGGDCAESGPRVTNFKWGRGLPVLDKEARVTSLL